MKDQNGKKTTGMKEVDLMKIEADRQYPGMWSYIHYSKAKPLGLRQGDIIQMTSDGYAIGEPMKVDEYVKWRNDLNRGYAGFRLVSVS